MQKELYMSKTSLASRILENAQTITKLNHNITQSHENKDKDLKSWQEACHVFNSSYNQLAFPGGLSEGLNALKKMILMPLKLLSNILTLILIISAQAITRKKSSIY